MESKEQLRLAYEAGVKSVSMNAERSAKLENGVKQIEEEHNFENWYSKQEPESKWETINKFKLMLGQIG